MRLPAILKPCNLISRWSFVFAYVGMKTVGGGCGRSLGSSRPEYLGQAITAIFYACLATARETAAHVSDQMRPRAAEINLAGSVSNSSLPRVY